MKKNRRPPVLTLEQTPAVFPLDQQSEGYLFENVEMPEMLAGYEFRECTFRNAVFQHKLMEKPDRCILQDSKYPGLIPVIHHLGKMVAGLAAHIHFNLIGILDQKQIADGIT